MGLSKKLSLMVLGAVTMGICLTGCGTGKEITDPSVYAIVNNKKITQKIVEDELTFEINALKETFGENYLEDMPEEDKKIFNSMKASITQMLIEEEILVAKAKELNLIENTDELEEKIEERYLQIKNNYPDEKSFKEALDTYNYTEETYKDSLRTQEICAITYSYICKDVTVNDEEIKEFYNNGENDNLLSKLPGADTKHILFASENEANKALEDMKNNTTSFDELFEKYNKNQDLKENSPIAENLGYVEYDKFGYDTDFLAGLKTVEENGISNPVKSSFGYHLIKATNIQKEAKKLSLEENKEKINTMLISKKSSEIFDATMEEWSKEYNVKYNKNIITE